MFQSWAATSHFSSVSAIILAGLGTLRKQATLLSGEPAWFGVEAREIPLPRELSKIIVISVANVAGCLSLQNWLRQAANQATSPIFNRRPWEWCSHNGPQCCSCLVGSVMSDSVQTYGCNLPFLHPWNSPGKNTGVIAMPFSTDLRNPGIEPRSPALKADSLPSKPPGKPHGPRYVATYSFLSETLNAWLYICAGQVKEGCICVQDRVTQALVIYTSLAKWEALYVSTRHKRANRY